MRDFRLLSFLAACSLLLAAGCPNRATVSPPSDPSTRRVERFLDAMIDDDQDGMKKMISPAWAEENDIDLDDYQVNAYSPESYEITKVKGSKVTAEIIFNDGDAHRLVFKVTKEGSKFYIEPGSYDEDEWIHPWVSVTTSVRK